MKRRLETNGSPSKVPHENFRLIRAESSLVETANSSNDLGERLMNLPIELREEILFSLTPKERCHLRLVSKAMMDAVDASMCDVQDINIVSPPVRKLKPNVRMTTINPYNGDKIKSTHMMAPSSLPFLLKWTGAQLKTLHLAVSPWEYEKDSYLSPWYQVFKALNRKNACPKLKNLSLDMGEYVWNNDEIVLSDLLKYIAKRQLQVKAADHPIPFLHSLSLFSDPHPDLPVDRLERESRRRFLQDLLDQCHGLKELEVDTLLMQRDLPIMALRYPTTLTCLKSERLGKAPGDLQTITQNCPNLQSVNLEIGFPHDDANFRALPALSDLRELKLRGRPTEAKIAWMSAQCLAAFKDYPFGASIARPWPQLKSVELDCYQEKDYVYIKYRLHLSGSYCCITTLHLTWCSAWRHGRYAPPVERLFKALNNEDACPNLMELYINSSEPVDRITISLAMKEDREPQAQELQSDDSYDDPPTISIPNRRVYGILNDLLAYVTKRQSEVQLGKPFLRSLITLGNDCDCSVCCGSYKDRDVPRKELKQIRNTMQNILDQCHGLEELYIESLEHLRVHRYGKKGKELMELMPLRFPTTLKTLNDVSLD